MRRRSVLPLALATVVTAAAVFVAVERNTFDHHPTGRSAGPSPTPSQATSPTRPTILAALDAAASMPTGASAKAAIGAALRSLPADEELSGSVVDVLSGTPLWSHGAHVPMAPASTTKLLTAAAALSTLGPDYEFTTSTQQVGDAVYLVGGGDPTLIRTPTSTVVPDYPHPASLADLASSTAAALTPGVPIHLRIDTSLWSGPSLANGWSGDYVSEGDVTPPSALELDGGRLHPANFDSERTPTPSAQAASAFESLLRADGVDIKGSVKAEPTPAGATSLGSVSSPPLSALVQRMLTESDNDLAEALGREVAIHRGMPADFTGAATAVLQQVAALGVPTSAVQLHDTSGLSHDDLIDPATLVAVLKAAASPAHPQLRPIVEGLPIAGFTGTLADRYRGHGAKAGGGVVRAKTGTLTGVDGLAGLVVDSGGRLLAFALLASGPESEDSVEQALDRITTALATLG